MNQTMKNYKFEKVAIGTITFTLQSSVYQLVNGNLERIEPSIERIEIGDTFPLIQLENDIAELPGGRFVIDIERQRPKICYGNVKTLGEVTICSPNGLILRKVSTGKCFSIRKIKPINEKLIHYYISDKEVITSLENIKVIVGKIIFNQDYALAHNGKPLLLKAQKEYNFSEVTKSLVYLSEEMIWLDTNEFNCSVSIYNKS